MVKEGTLRFNLVPILKCFDFFKIVLAFLGFATGHELRREHLLKLRKSSRHGVRSH